MQMESSATWWAGTRTRGVMVAAFLLSQLALADPSAGDRAAPVDARTRKEVLEELARKLESQYAIPDMATKLAKAVRAKEKANAYSNVASATEFARALTSDLYAVAHDKHLRVNFSFGPVPQGATGARLPAPDFVQ